MDNVRILHEKAVDWPERISNDATGTLVDILDHRETIESSLPADFSWLMCDKMQSVGVVKKWYSRENDVYEASKVDNATSVSSLDPFRDSVVFHAVELDADAPAVEAWTTPSPSKKSQVKLEVAKSTEHGCIKPTRLEPLSPSLSVRTTSSSLPTARASPLTSAITSHTDSPTYEISSDGFVHRKQQTSVNQLIEKMLKTPPSRNKASTMEAVPEIFPLLPSDLIKPHGDTYSEQPSREDLMVSFDFEPPIAIETPLSDIQSKFSEVLEEAGCLKDPQAHKPPIFVALDGNNSAESSSTLFVATPHATPPPAPKPSTSYLRLQKLLTEGSPEDLEAEVSRSLSLLEQLKISVSSHTEPYGIQQWSQQIETLKQQNVREPTIIGVVGNTGAGKSSVINAILDEERLVPTNCMRACTAVVTEMSWNDSDEENEKYRADIEFIQSTDWETELRILFAEILDGNGKVSREACSDADSGVGVAYAKIKAVYPYKTKDDISKSSVHQLMQDPAIREVLGTTRKICEAKPESFYNSLQHYVDSREKPSDGKNREMALWPLIKVVKIYTKSDALSTGAVIVDLPGVMDSNAARGSVAKSYVKKCTGLWIVAPINRAVDDGAARNLMGDAFKRQLKYDGTYSHVTFICSKTDDISVTEASESLGIDDEISPKWDQIDLITKDRRRLTKGIQELKMSQAVYCATLSGADEQLELRDRFIDDLENDKMVSASAGGSKKRKMPSLKIKQRKRRAPMGDSDDDDFNSDTSDDEATQQFSSPESSQFLAVQGMNDKISELKETADARMQRRDFTTKLNDVKDELKTLKAKHAKIMAEISTICISTRNLYSKSAIQRDFATGIKELDQEVAEEIDEASFDPEEDQRDYDEVARSLPVFCVSSRAYQKLSGRFKRDKAVPGFSSPDQTEIPQLQAHCKKLTEAGRLATSRRFLNAFSQLVNSMTMWSTNDGSGNGLTDEEMAMESRFLRSKLSQLEGDLQKTVQTCINEMRESLAENIYDNFNTAVGAAVDEANNTVTRWGAPVNREIKTAGGFYWATYKAICRRNGVYEDDAHNSIDFNDQLSVPMIKRLSSHWETTFVRRLPSIMKSFTKSAKNPLHAFHQSVEARTTKIGVSLAGFDMLRQQLRTYEAILEDLSIQMRAIIKKSQRDASRQFVPVVARNLLSAYTYCSNETGKGSYMRMKDHMIGHVDSQRVTMFREATQEVKGHLKHICLQVEKRMTNEVEEVCENIRRDYTQAVTGCYIPEGYQASAGERAMKIKVAKLLDPLKKIWEDTTEESGGDEIKEEMVLDNPLNDWPDAHSDPSHEKIPVASPPPSTDANPEESAAISISPNVTNRDAETQQESQDFIVG